MPESTDADMEFVELPLSQSLILEVLAARHRLGENLWTFEKRRGMSIALHNLAIEGWVTYKSGIIENTYLVAMTAKARDVLLSVTYEPPILKGTRREL